MPGPGHIVLRPSRCIVARQKRVPCRSCQRACPMGTVSLQPLPTPGLACNGCLACVHACPTGALSAAPEIRSSLLDTLGSQKREIGEDFRIGCERAGEPPDHLLTCLAGVGLMELLELLTTGARRVVLDARPCSGCPFESAMPALLRAAADAGRLARWLELPGRVKVPGAESLKGANERPNGSRRALFSALRRSLETAVSDEEAPGVQVSEIDDWPTRDRLAALIRGRPEFAEAPGSFPHVPACRTGRLKVSESCDGCSVCSRLCPTGAITRRLESKAIMIGLYPSRCVSCGVCAKLCPRDAVSVKPVLDPLGLLLDKELTLRRVGSKVCVACGARFAVSESVGPACGPCSRRYSPLYIQSLQARQARRRGSA